MTRDDPLKARWGRDPAPAGASPASGRAARRWLVAAAAAAVTAAAGAGAHAAAVPATGDRPRPVASGAEEDLWHRQDLLSDLRYWIEALPGIGSSGYITSITDPAAGSTVLVWHGAPDPWQRRIVDEAHRRRIPVTVQRRVHAMQDLQRAANRLAAVGSGTGVFRNFAVGAVATFDVGFDGVTVTGYYLTPPAGGVAAADADLTRALTAATGVAVLIEHGRVELARP